MATAIAPKTPCPRCGLPVGPHHRARHMRACERMPLPDEMRCLAKSMTVADMARAWNSSPATVTSRLRRAYCDSHFVCDN